jgi:Uma2 family endonuclease
MITLNLQPHLQLTNETFEQLCRNNPDLRLERTAQGELVAMSPTGSESGRQNWLFWYLGENCTKDYLLLPFQGSQPLTSHQ